MWSPFARLASSGALLLILAGPSIAATMKAGTALPAENPTPPRETFSIVYRVIVDDHSPQTVSVRWELSGIQEISRLRFKLEGKRYSDFSGTGQFERKGRQLTWKPGSPYAHLSYRVSVNHRRSSGKGYDSYAGPHWILTRTDDLFPDVAVSFRVELEPRPEARARLVFELPNDWSALTPLPREPGTGSFIVERPNQHFDRPWGWLLLGRVSSKTATIGGCEITVGTAPGAKLDRSRVLKLLRKSLPEIRELVGQPPPRILIVSAPDPTWRGGLSGEASFFIHGDRPLRTPDKTSPLLHELFHVLAPFTPTGDAHWVTEGLAEYYSLEIQRRVGEITLKSFAKGIERFRRYGHWNTDFTKARDPAVTNNSAPLIMYAIDRSLQTSTNGAKSLDDAVAHLSRLGGRIATADFLRAVNELSDKNMTEFFTRHVFRGKPPRRYDPAELAKMTGRKKQAGP